MTRRGWLLFIALSVIWGIPYLLIKVAVRDLTPASLVFLRTALGAALLFPLALARGNLRALLPRWRPVVLFTVVELGVPWFLLSDAERRVSSSLAGLLVASVPLVGAQENGARIAEYLEQMFKRDGAPMVFSQRFSCIDCGFSFPELTPRMFSFNNPQGACPACGGLGTKRYFDPDLIVPNSVLSLNEGAILPWKERSASFLRPILEGLAGASVPLRSTVVP